MKVKISFGAIGLLFVLACTEKPTEPVVTDCNTEDCHGSNGKSGIDNGSGPTTETFPPKLRDAANAEGEYVCATEDKIVATGDDVSSLQLWVKDLTGIWYPDQFAGKEYCHGDLRMGYYCETSPDYMNIGLRLFGKRVWATAREGAPSDDFHVPCHETPVDLDDLPTIFIDPIDHFDIYAGRYYDWDNTYQEKFGTKTPSEVRGYLESLRGDWGPPCGFVDIVTIEDIRSPTESAERIKDHIRAMAVLHALEDMPIYSKFVDLADETIFFDVELSSDYAVASAASFRYGSEWRSMIFDGCRH